MSSTLSLIAPAKLDRMRSLAAVSFLRKPPPLAISGSSVSYVDPLEPGSQQLPHSG